MHGDDDQIVPYAHSGPLSAKLLKNGSLKTYKDFPHGMPTTHADVINADLLAFIKAKASLRNALLVRFEADQCSLAGAKSGWLRAWASKGHRADPMRPAIRRGLRRPRWMFRATITTNG